MKLFSCPNCNNSIFFENTHCGNCGSFLGFNPLSQNFETSTFNGLSFCKNHQLNICNWFVTNIKGDRFCKACALNRKVPNQRNSENFSKWKNLEKAKHRLIYQLLKFYLPLQSKLENSNGIAFDFFSDDNDDKVLTGHANGVITILLSEADSVHREQLRKKLNEPYRTLLGHFRHEIGHYYWDVLFNNENISAFRTVFGDERANYGESLTNYYKNGTPNYWNRNFISEYASSHPWEDWAETWAHYLHLMDTLETANAFGLTFNSNNIFPNGLTVSNFANPYQIRDFKHIFESSMALTCAANSLNRSMGLPDIYPFVIPHNVFLKLNFIHNTLSPYRIFN